MPGGMLTWPGWSLCTPGRNCLTGPQCSCTSPHHPRARRSVAGNEKVGALRGRVHTGAGKQSTENSGRARGGSLKKVAEWLVWGQGRGRGIEGEREQPGWVWEGLGEERWPQGREGRDGSGPGPQGSEGTYR